MVYTTLRFLRWFIICDRKLPESLKQHPKKKKKKNCCSTLKLLTKTEARKIGYGCDVTENTKTLKPKKYLVPGQNWQHIGGSEKGQL